MSFLLCLFWGKYLNCPTLRFTRRRRRPLEKLSVTSATPALKAYASQAGYDGLRRSGCRAAMALGHIAARTKPVTADGRDLELFSEACNERLAA